MWEAQLGYFHDIKTWIILKSCLDGYLFILLIIEIIKSARRLTFCMFFTFQQKMELLMGSNYDEFRHSHTLFSVVSACLARRIFSKG